MYLLYLKYYLEDMIFQKGTIFISFSLGRANTFTSETRIFPKEKILNIYLDS